MLLCLLSKFRKGFATFSWCSWLYLPLAEVLSALGLYRSSWVRALRRVVIDGRFFVSFQTRLIASIVSTLRLTLVRVEVVKEQVIVFTFVFEVIYHFLFFVDFDSKASLIVENVFVIIHIVCLSGKTATPGYNELPFWRIVILRSYSSRSCLLW